MLRSDSVDGAFDGKAGGRASGWGFAPLGGEEQPSLSEVYASIPVPKGASWLRRLLAFSGPGYMVSVGYMDPGNWATDIAGGSKFGYTLLAVIMLSNLMAILLQALARGLASPPAAILLRPAATPIRVPLALLFGSLAKRRSSLATLPRSSAPPSRSSSCSAYR